MPESCVIVGAGITGVRAAHALRQGGFSGEVTLVGAEPDPPYERPPLSKEFLQGNKPLEKVWLHPAAFYTEQRIALRTGTRARALDATGCRVLLESGESLPYDRLLIASGASPRRMDVPGGDLAGVYYLRTLRDAQALRAELQPGRRVVVVGAGFIGAEVAATCRGLGLHVTLLEAAPVPLLRALGEEMGTIYARLHRERGVELHVNQALQAFAGSGRVHEVRTAAGQAFPCDFAVVGVGVAPEVAWLQGSGLALENGVPVNEFCETNLPGVYAAGDVANWWYPAREERLRVEHFDHAQFHGVGAAHSMLGQRQAYNPILFFWSDQYDLRLQYVGHASRWDQIVYRGDPGGASFVAFYVLEGQVLAALGINRPRDILAARRWLRAPARLPLDALQDEKVELKSLQPAAS